MKRIASFEVDHTQLRPGLYVSRRDRSVTTFDLRFVRPNHDSYISQAALHTIEHLGATFLRNHPQWHSRIVYFGPMGCRTGCYLLLSDWHTVSSKDSPVCVLVMEMLEYIVHFDSDIPGATKQECGNYLEHDLPGAQKWAKHYLYELRHHPHFKYPIIEKKETQ